MVLNWTDVLYLLIAAAIATFIRFYDSPVTPINEAKVIAVAEVFVGAVIAAFVALMTLSANGTVDVTQWNNFVVVIAAAVGGIAFVKSVIGAVTPVTPVVPPAAPPKA
jgi:hypothetical protein